MRWLDLPNITPFHKQHIEAGARMVDFGGWDMPINYGSQIEEHHAVREDAGMFDVSHMTIIDIHGADAKAYLQRLLTHDVAKLTQTGSALYSGMLNHDGGIIDDLIVYFLSDTQYRMVVNAATREKDLKWLEEQSASFDVELTERKTLAMLAIQGPNAISKTQSVFSTNQVNATQSLKPFSSVASDDFFIARTGYTGEDGYEIILPAEQAEHFWQKLLNAKVRPCGLGARDTLRLEAGMNLYGADMDESVSPLVSNMAWTVTWEPSDRQFIGREALETEKKKGVEQKLVGLILESKGVLRAHQPVIVEGIGEGQTTSGTMSPTLKKSIALARVPKATGDSATVDIRGKHLPVKVVKPCFVRKGSIIV